MTRNVRLGVVGAGAIGPSHVYAIEQTDGAELAAICDRDPERAARLAAAHGVPHFSSIAAMVADVELDAVTIGTPSGFHLDSALEAIAAGKHVLVEKPLEIDTERVDRIIGAASEQGVKVAGVFQSRFRPVARRLKELVDEGLLGEIYSASAYTKRYRTQEYYDSGGWRGTWEVDGGGCLMNQGIHLVDLLLWFVGDVDRIIALTSSVGRDVEVETLALALVQFTCGARGVIEGSTVAYPELPQYLEIFGSRGTLTFNSHRLLRMDLISPTAAEQKARETLFADGEKFDRGHATARAAAAPGTPIPEVDMGHGPVVADFVDAIREDRLPLIHGLEARRSVEVITAIYESGRRGGESVLLGKGAAPRKRDHGMARPGGGQ